MDSSSRYRVLSPEQERQFLEKGYLVVEGCLDPELARRWTDRAYQRLGCSRDDPESWPPGITWMDHETRMPVRTVSPRAWAAICDVAGGEERLETKVLGLPNSGHFTTMNSFEWSDAFIVNFRNGSELPWIPPSPALSGWHKDGSYFRHFLDSREQSLLTVVLWSDVQPQGGGTFIAPDSVRIVARYLYEHPEGVEPNGFGRLIDQCKEFVEISGPTGTFAILHPFMLHASSRNHSGRPRFMSNPPIILKDHQNLNRSDPREFSLLERATLHALGMERCDFRPTAPRRSDWWVVGEGS
ncbi:MAG TPA: phytanoyl-CoA dioxygenase family protein [Spirochaetia bacterium]|nr:phytanoyl-CoA dioxygenase family protein [Spirochaetia bacterium]